MREEIRTYLNQFDFDVRKSNDARFVDHKCTPDIVSFIADCVLNMIATKPVFVITDIWETEYFIHNSRVIFNKPWANDERAYNEYNKVLSQPLKLLAYAHVLNVEKIKGRLTFSVINEDLLDYISRKDRNAYYFLYCYFIKVLEDSGFMRFMIEYKEKYHNNLAKERMILYDKYHRFISGNTPTKTRIDTRRMFHKVLNVYAVENNIPGSSGKFAMTYSDLMYNRRNWRDLEKDKSITRQESSDSEIYEKQEIINTYYIQKAINLIKKIHKESEVHDQWNMGEATQVHHIFQKSLFPEIAHYAENLIKLTATQHYTKAHPNNRTQEIDKDYQLTCLLAKADTIEKSIQLVGEKYYRKESFIYVCNIGLSVNIEINLSFTELTSRLIQIYNGVA
ncbi:MAG: hypothetical protein LBU83_10680 [Bacteroidales bacterium]|jgi:hypothetical protein|nr:hypothetical protein [Bacteroidales bacterium]